MTKLNKRNFCYYLLEIFIINSKYKYYTRKIVTNLQMTIFQNEYSSRD